MALLLWVWLPTLLVMRWKWLTNKLGQPVTSDRRESFIVFRLDALGDLVLTTPLFRELKRLFPHARLTVVVRDAFQSVVVTNPNIDEVLTLAPLPKKGLLLPKGARYLLAVLIFYWQNLRGREFDVAISPRWDTDEHLATMLALLTSAELRVGYSECTSIGKRRFNRGFDKAFDACLPPGCTQHEVSRNLAVIEGLGGSVQNDHLEIHLAEGDREYAFRILQAFPRDCRVIALGIGAQSPGRRWPLERYVACILELGLHLPVRTIITCAPAEHAEAARLAAMFLREPIISDSPDIRETCALLERCDLFIGNDTGAAHLAAAMRCPTIVISRHPKSGDPTHPNSPLRFAPYGVTSRVLQPEHGLPGCTNRCMKVESHCINQVSASEVVEAAMKMIAPGMVNACDPEEMWV